MAEEGNPDDWVASAEQAQKASSAYKKAEKAGIKPTEEEIQKLYFSKEAPPVVTTFISPKAMIKRDFIFIGLKQERYIITG